MILPFLIGGILVIGAAVTSIGLAMATWFSRLGRAVAMSVGLYAAVSIGWIFVVVSFASPRPYGEGLLMGSPFAFVLILCGEAVKNLPDRGYLVAATFWIIVSSIVSSVVYRLTLASFNTCLGRVETGLLQFGRYPDPPMRLVIAEEIAYVS